ncbi:MAG: hypothetical protein ACRC33_27485 [Gemmataceae bacterium]
MTDVTTRRPLRVSGGGDAGPYLMVPVGQLDEVKGLLDGHRIRYWVDENAISLNGEPAVAIVNFGRGTEGGKVQALLDGRP